MAINFLLGKGERLTTRISAPRKPSEKVHPYSLSEARKWLSPRIKATSHDLDQLPGLACPQDEAVAIVTLHPAYLAKSYFPEDLFDLVHIYPVGSRPKTIQPKKWTRKKHPESTVTAEIFVAGPRKAFHDWAHSISQWTDSTENTDDLRKLENIHSFPPEERLRGSFSENRTPLLEVVLHAKERHESDFVLEGFRNYLRALDISVDLDKRLYAEGLCFLPVEVPKQLIREVAKFSFLRVAREMPRLRTIIRSVGGPKRIKAELPKDPPIDPNIRVAVFDGGVPKTPDLSPWVKRLVANGVTQSVKSYQEHGLAVTSALLFGPLEDGRTMERPFAGVDHYRVLDKNTGQDARGELFDVLKRIKDTLESKRYDFVNLSIGPDLPIEDDEVHVWTAILDQIFAGGNILPCIAAGNGGEYDHDSGNARIQSPADCVNGMAIGSCDSLENNWKRVSHSSIGPGRSPGIVKPDIVAFGGCSASPYLVLSENLGHALPVNGTSFASPTALRVAIGVRAILGSALAPLALKALLIHRCEKTKIPRSEVGWGRVLSTPDELITCEDDTAHIVYQGELSPSQWLRAKIPVPKGPLSGMVEISATFCFATATDPQDPIHYTRSGLEVTFRPNENAKKKSAQLHPDSQGFFRSETSFQTEHELRADSHKWETTLHASKKFRGNRLDNPCFDIHYNAREGGRNADSPRKIPYALIVTVKASQIKDLYNQIVQRYRTVLETLQPVIQVPIQVRVRS